MDSITQITLGAAVGEAALGHRIGNKAAAWGAFFGVLPDLDVLANPFVSQVQEIAIHRGISHSIFFSLVGPIAFGWLLHRWYQRSKMAGTERSKISWIQWAGLIFGAISTHIFIDSLTNYGTQIFQPFSNYAVSLNTIFIIDPLYTIPLMVGIVSALFMNRSNRHRRWANYLGLGLSSLYLLWGFGVKLHVDSVVEENFEAQQIQADQYMTNPMPFNSLLWVTYARSGDQIYAGLYSILDDEQFIDFVSVPMRKDLLEKYRDDLAVQRVLWFSQGYYSVHQEEDQLIFTDLRFGRSDLWLTDDASFAWQYELVRNPSETRVTALRHRPPTFAFNEGIMHQLWSRIMGEHLP
ncbi:MAG: metal-dependent hydrolase [Bacteroidota bacterium]